MLPSEARIMVRSIKFFNSRMFPGPGIIDDQVGSFRRESEEGLFELFVEPRHDIERERQNVFPSFAQRVMNKGTTFRR